MQTEVYRSHSSGRAKYYRENLLDLFNGAKLTRIWATWAYIEMRQRYRRSIIGSLWITLNLMAMISGLSLVFSTLFKQDITDFIPYVTAGLVCWQTIVAFINNGCDVFINSSGNLLRYNLPASVYIFKSISGVVINFLHTFLVVIAVVLIFDVPINLNSLLLVPALFLLSLNALWFSIVFGLLCLRYRDIPMIVGNLVQVCFFITPVFWHSDRLGTKEYLLNFNPFTHFVQIFRDPILGKMPALIHYYCVGGITLVGLTLSIFVWMHFRHRIPYML